MITEDGFWKDRRTSYARDLTPEIEANAAETMRRANLLLAAFYAANPNAPRRNATSGWRPPSVNATTPNAARKSHHMMGRAVDIADADGLLDKWCVTMAGNQALIQIGLWLEHPSKTPTWCHVQIVPPGSGNRVFYP